jgi:hypothetical protein
MYRALAALLPTALLGLLVTRAATAGGDKGFVELFNGKDLTGFKTILASGKEDDGKTFSVKDGAIVVSGKPNGYFYTDKSYKNYVLRFDWKFTRDGNSGLLVHIQGKHKVWPKCVEVQGQQGDHARIFAIGGASFDGKTTTKDKEARAAGTKAVRAAQKQAIKKNEWNTTEVICKNGAITSKINGVEIDTGKGDLMDGQIGWQSEGTELHFKNIKIKVLD